MSQIGDVPVKLRISGGEAREGAGEAGPWEEFGACGSSAGGGGRLMHPSPAGRLGSLAPLGPSCQALRHLRPGRRSRAGGPSAAAVTGGLVTRVECLPLVPAFRA